MKRELAVLIIAMALVLAASATAFAYRAMSGTVSVRDYTDPGLVGAACVGFYSHEDQPNALEIMPKLGSNYDAPTYHNNKITVTPSGIVCQVSTSGGPVNLYESIYVTVPITVGHWIIRDFYAIGYPSTRDGGTVYLYVRVVNILGDQGEPSFQIAKLWFYLVLPGV